MRDPQAAEKMQWQFDSAPWFQRQGSALLCEREQDTLTKNDNASGKLSVVAQGSPSEISGIRTSRTEADVVITLETAQYTAVAH